MTNTLKLVSSVVTCSLLACTLVSSTDNSDDDWIELQSSEDEWDTLDQELTDLPNKPKSVQTAVQLSILDEQSKREAAYSSKEWRIPVLDHFSDRYPGSRDLMLGSLKPSRVLHLPEHPGWVVKEEQVCPEGKHFCDYPRRALILGRERNLFWAVKSGALMMELTPHIFDSLLMFDADNPHGRDLLANPEEVSRFVRGFRARFKRLNR